jgi:hypothetical protein
LEIINNYKNLNNCLFSYDILKENIFIKYKSLDHLNTQDKNRKEIINLEVSMNELYTEEKSNEEHINDNYNSKEIIIENKNNNQEVKKRINELNIQEKRNEENINDKNDQVEKNIIKFDLKDKTINEIKDQIKLLKIKYHKFYELKIGSFKNLENLIHKLQSFDYFNDYFN